MAGLHRLPLIEQKALDEWGTVSSPVGRQRRWKTNLKLKDAITTTATCVGMSPTVWLAIVEIEDVPVQILDGELP